MAAELIDLVVLVEDDDNDIIITKRKIGRSYLNVKELIVTKSLKETLDVIKTRKVDVILLDLNLSDSQGLDTVRKIRETYAGIIIVLTSVNNVGIGLESIRAGADSYIPKHKLDEDFLGNEVYFSIERRKRWNRVESIKENLDKLDNLATK